MAGRLRIRRPGRPRRGDMLAGAVVLFVAFCVLVTATTFFIEHELRPTGSFFGVPGRLDFPLCGRSYLLGQGDDWTMARIGGPTTPGYGPPILEPTIGKIPLLGLFSCPMTRDGFYYTVIWLHVGPDDYKAYALEGGP